jgi:hypothetical protein
MGVATDFDLDDWNPDMARILPAWNYCQRLSLMIFITKAVRARDATLEMEAFFL